MVSDLYPVLKRIFWIMHDKYLNNLKKGVWIYLFLLIFEGALRKWILPGLATPLLLVRDPIALWLILYSINKKIWQPNSTVILVILVSSISFVLTLVFGHGNLAVAIFGLRILIVQFPLIFVIGTICTRNDVVLLGRFLLYVSILMTLIVIWQFFSPQSAWINRGVAGDTEGSGFSGAGGFFRVPGTFSFSNGLTLFYGLIIPFLVYFWTTNEVAIKKWLLYLATISYAIAVPLTISRTVFFQTIVTILFLVLISFQNKRVISSIFRIAIGLCFVLLIISFLDFFQTATDAFTQRFTNASRVEGGIEGTLVDRFLGSMYRAVSYENFSWFGQGLGMGTNAGAKLLGSEGEFLISEGEWGRVLGEMGIILGGIILIIRIGISINWSLRSWILAKNNDSLPWLLLSFGAISIVQGQWGQPTAQGFSIFVGGIIYAIIRNK